MSRRVGGWVVLGLAALGCAEGPTTSAPHVQLVTAPGSLQSLQDLGCASPEALRNDHTAADLARSSARCIDQGDYPSAVFSSALGGVYSRYDALRVADVSARAAETAVMVKYLSDVSPEQQRAFMAALSEVADDPDRFAAMCGRIRAIGPPDYHPRYMIQHGMKAILGAGIGDGLVTPFDGPSAWDRSLDSYLHCPSQ